MTTFLGAVAGELREALAPLEESIADESSIQLLLERHGWSVDLQPGAADSIRTIFGIGDLLRDAERAAEQLAGPSGGGLEFAVKLKDAAVALFGKLRELHPSTNLSAFPFDQEAFWRQMSVELVDELLVEHLVRRVPLAFAVLHVLGVIEIESEQPSGTGRVPYIRTTLRWDLLGEAVGDPGSRLRKAYDWGPASALDHPKLVDATQRSLSAFGVPVRRAPLRPALASKYYDPASTTLPAVRELAIPLLGGAPATATGYVEIGLLLVPIPPKGAKGSAPDGIALTTMARGSAAAGVELGGGVSLTFAGGFEADGAVTLEAHPNRLEITGSPPQPLEVSAALRLRRPEPVRILGTRGSHRLELGGALAAVRARGSLADPEMIVELGTGDEIDPPKLALVVQFADGDSFLGSLFGREPQRLEAGGLVTWSSKTGLAIQGDVGLTVQIPINRTVGVVELKSLTIALHTAGDGVDLILALTGGASIGPIAASVEHVGIKLALARVKPGEPPGTFGNLDLVLGFKPPDRLGLVVEAGPVTGGGYVAFDEANGRYAGVLELSFASISIKAIGLLDTKLPGGAPGYSFLIIVTAQFPPIQLGFGFTLNGVGGLAGIHRTMVTEVLQAGIRDHSVDHILFPEDPVRDAAQIISDLAAIFPPAQGRFVFGPMAIIAYTTILEVELGIILEVPAPVRLVLLGQIHAFLPKREAAAAELHLDVLGVLDFGRKTLAIDASLHDSRLAAFTLYGDMAMRLAWGDEPAFALALGGFNPRFKPPVGFPALRRLTLALGEPDGNPSFKLEVYVALTSNTLQLGARVEAQASALGFTIRGWLGFNVLVIFSPFSFVADFTAGLSLKRGSSHIATVTLDASLSGPTPWHAWGEATLDSIIDITIGFDVTFGEDVEEALAPADPSSALVEALSDARNWSATMPPASATLVSLAPASDLAVGVALVDPLGAATVRQRVVPLNRRITKFGEARASGPGRYTVGAVKVGASSAAAGPMVQEHFAPAQFEQLDDAARLSRPSFEKMDAGVSLASDAVTVGPSIGTDVMFDTVIADRPDTRKRDAISSELAAAALGSSASAAAPLANTGAERFAPPAGTARLVSVAEELYAIASTETLKEILGVLSERTTKGAAYQVLDGLLAAQPWLRSRVAVVPEHELAA